MALIEAVGVASLRKILKLTQKRRVKRSSGKCILNRHPVDLGSTGDVVEGFCSTFDLEAIDTNFNESLNVLDGPEVLRVHDIGAMLIFEDRHQFARTIFFLKKVDFICQRMPNLIPTIGAVEPSVQVCKAQP